mgnify:CR=1 FL=1|jgi:hypothetical protein
MNREFEIEELDEKIKFLFSIKVIKRAMINHCIKYESCSKDVILERIKLYKEKQRFKNGRPIR